MHTTLLAQLKSTPSCYYKYNTNLAVKYVLSSSRRRYKRKEPVSGVKIEYIYEDRYSEIPRDVSTPEAEEESRDEWIAETNQPENTEDSKGEAIELTQCESKDESPIEDVKREDIKTEDIKSEEPRREEPCDTCEAVETSSPIEETGKPVLGSLTVLAHWSVFFFCPNRYQ